MSNLPSVSAPRPPTRFDFATHNEDASVELLLLDTLLAAEVRPLRVLTIAGCGTHAIAMCSVPQVERIDAVDIARPQLHLGALTSAATGALSSPEELAVFLGNSGCAAERRALFDRVAPRLPSDTAEFWADNLALFELGVLRCGGTERLLATIRGHLPTQDLRVLARSPDAIQAAFEAGFTVAAMRDSFVGVKEESMAMIARCAPPQIGPRLAMRVAERADRAPDLLVELFVRGTYPMTPSSSRPQFLRPDVFAAVQRHGCGPDRLAWHEGRIEQVGPQLAAATARYDLVDLSNAVNAESPTTPELLRVVLGLLRPGGIVVCRGSRPPGPLAQACMASGFDVDEALSARAASAESSFLHQEVCVATPSGV